ncbi:acyltransferase [Desulfosporosinus sp. BICA1-9]|uniref:acyltransferase family protein n=1 Tax=Desulfosporosinus sp. BICA1-9 TaxID=1531958 RepID=UPI00054B293B|nr:acyltransferase [Desulfosporosinus sp. BICA1-9]KJS46037.1 MAG: hypothetical protein VR66_27600 [Peptococcaceae bacterium BRH_c23]KJS88002.1 MAG: hypothetical protein JL57_12825 [Desulfosporosinus sp. BICA1-9]HBW37313.1 acyltransferase [Desulfosporosinus sp.]
MTDKEAGRAESKREYWLDVAKGEAIIAVVMGHVVASYHNSGLLLEATGFNFVHSFIASFQMPLFFVISGYLYRVTDQRDVTLGNKIGKKVLSYGIPYIIFSIGYWILKAFTSGYVNTKLDISDLILIPVYPISFMWFIYALMVITIIAILLDSRNYNKKVILAVSFIAMLILPYISKLEILSQINFTDTFLYDVLKWFFYFYLGAHAGASFIKWLEVNKKNNTMFILNGIAMVALVIISFNFVQINSLSIIGVIKAFLCITFFLQLSYRIVQNKILEHIGKNSFPIYLIHGVVIAATRIIMDRLGILIAGGWSQLCICTIAGTILPLMLYKICQKIWVIDFCFYPNRYLGSDKYQNK